MICNDLLNGNVVGVGSDIDSIRTSRTSRNMHRSCNMSGCKH